MKKLAAILLLLVVLSLAGASIWYLRPNHPGPRGVSGTIEVDEVHVASRYGGRVAKILAQEGDSLKTGQVLVEIEAAELCARREQVAALLAEWEAGPRAEELAAARSDWEALLAELEFVQADEKRARELFAQKAISETERDRASTKLRALEKNIAAAKARFDLLAAGTRAEKLAQMRAQLSELEAQLRELKITAPSDAVLELLSVKTGDVLPPNREVATLLLAGHLWVRVFVPETWLGHLAVGQKVRARVDSFPGKDFVGAIEMISRAAEFTPRNVQTTDERIKQVFAVKVRLENEQDRLRAGMSADVYFAGTPE